MIKLTRQDWQTELAQVITDWNELCALLHLDPSAFADQVCVTQAFTLRVPRPFVARMQPGNPRDPLLLQVLPQARELISVPGYSYDPLQESKANPVPGLLHKYSSRVLLTLVGSCAINCRYCFRRHFPYEENVLGRKNWQAMFDYIQQHPAVEEVILSGGEPLLLKDETLKILINELQEITHVKRLRIHTRLPIVIPQRITASFIDVLKSSRLQPVIVLHCNHPNEIDASLREAFQLLRHANIVTFNQSVLLKDINDDAQVLSDLSKKLFEDHVIFYYLHLLDPVMGSAHFKVDEKAAKNIMKQMQANLPGYLVPKLVREIAGESGKVSVA